MTQQTKTQEPGTVAHPQDAQSPEATEPAGAVRTDADEAGTDETADGAVPAGSGTTIKPENWAKP